MHARNYVPVNVETLVLPAGRHRRWIQAARDMATRSTHKFQMGAVAVCSSRLLGSGVNVSKNRSSQVRWSRVSRHAEAVLASKVELEGATVYVARVRKDGSDGCARPCMYCLRLLGDRRVRTVVWTAGSGLVGIERLASIDMSTSDLLRDVKTAGQVDDFFAHVDDRCHHR